MTFLRNTSYTDRDGIVDALFRMLEGIDYADEELLLSAFTEDVVFDLTGIDTSMGNWEAYHGRDEAIRRLMDTVGLHMDTMHATSNIRVEITGDTARLTCYLIGQHFPAGQGPSVEFEDYLLLGNRLEVDLVRDHDHEWLVRRNRASSRWSVRHAAHAAN